MKISRKGTCIAVSVQNPGEWKAGDTTAGVGLKNLRERIRLQYREGGHFDIHEHPHGIIVATLLIPCT